MLKKLFAVQLLLRLLKINPYDFIERFFWWGYFYIKMEGERPASRSSFACFGARGRSPSGKSCRNKLTFRAFSFFRHQEVHQGEKDHQPDEQAGG